MNTKPIHYVIIDDHPDIRDGVKYFIDRHSNFQLAGEFDNIRTALNEKPPVLPNVLILDLNLEGTDALKYVPQLKQRFPGCGIIAYTQYPCTRKELETAGVQGYLDKRDRNQLIDAIQAVAAGGSYFKTGKSAAPAEDNVYADVYEKFKKLTRRQLEVAELIHHHITNRSIGRRLFISQVTVETHRKTIKKILNASSREDFHNMLRIYFDIPENTCWPNGLPEEPPDPSVDE